MCCACQVRNGIGRLEIGARSFVHAFDGFAKLVSFDISSDDELLFSSRFLRSRFYNDSMQANDIAPYIILDATQPQFGALEKLAALYNGVDNTNVNVYSVRRREGSDEETLLAVSDFWGGYTVDASSLHTLARVQPELPVKRFLQQLVPLPSTSHPVREFNTSNRIGFVSYLSPLESLPSYVDVVRMSSVSGRQAIASVHVDRVPYMHSLAVSPRYAVLMADPLYVNTQQVLSTVRPLDALQWLPASPTTLYVIELRTSRVLTLRCPARVHMHHINSYETRHSLVVDYVAYPDISFLRSLKVAQLRNESQYGSIRPRNSIVRYVINVKSRTVRKQTDFNSRRNLTFTNRLDFPTINENYRHRKHCYVYGVVLMMDNINLANTSLVKKDMCKGRDKFWAVPNHFASEAVFVASPGAAAEDDGVLLTVVLDGHGTGSSYLAVLDAKTMKLLSKAILPSVIPFTLHGQFLRKTATAENKQDGLIKDFDGKKTKQVSNEAKQNMTEVDEKRVSSAERLQALAALTLVAVASTSL